LKQWKLKATEVASSSIAPALALRNRGLGRPPRDANCLRGPCKIMIRVAGLPVRSRNSRRRRGDEATSGRARSLTRTRCHCRGMVSSPPARVPVAPGLRHHDHDGRCGRPARRGRLAGSSPRPPAQARLAFGSSRPPPSSGPAPAGRGSAIRVTAMMGRPSESVTDGPDDGDMAGPQGAGGTSI
jgi:hypothetical protein